MDDNLIRWKPKAEADMRKWVGNACEKIFKGRYQGDSEFVRGLFIEEILHWIIEYTRRITIQHWKIWNFIIILN